MHKFSKWQLFQMLTAGCKHAMGDTFYPPSRPNGVFGYLQSIQRDDGSGSSFNVTIRTAQGEMIEFHLRTVD